MGTEDYWQQQKKINEMNIKNTNPLLKQTYEDMKELIPAKGAKYQYVECLKGALYFRQWAQSADLTLDDMGTLICRDMGCELQYCQQSMVDPYERPFNNCDAQFRNLNRCIAQEQERYQSNPENRTMQEQVLYMLEKKKKEKYFNILNEYNVVPIEGKEYIIKEDKPILSHNV
jgi:hypothetical protein